MPKIRIRFAPPEDLRFKETFFLVEATGCEQHFLWSEWHKRVKWEEQGMGCTGQIGTLDRRPVMLTFFWARINGKLVGFWDSTSQVVDHKMIEKWLAENCTPPKCDNGTRSAQCDAMNFHHCIHAIQEANKAGLSLATA